MRLLLRIRFPQPSVVPTRRARASARRKAAASLGIGFTLFFAVQIGLGWAVHTERNPLRDPIYFDKFELLRRHPAFFTASPNRPTTVLFIGSSRTLDAVDSRAAAAQLTERLGTPVEAFNFGQAGAGPITNAVYIRRLLKEGVKPDYAVIEIHPTFLAGQRPDPPETRWLLPIRLRPDELPVVRAMGFPAEDPAVHGPRGFLAPFYEYRFLIVDRYAPWFLMNNQRLNGGHESDEYGFARLQQQVNPTDRPYLQAIAFRQYERYFDGYRPTGCGVNGIRDAIEVCQAHGIRPALALLPETGDWQKWYDGEGLKELNALTARLGSEYGVPVFDCRDWVPHELTVDGHHLAGAGADLFTRRIVNEALVPWMERSRAKR